MNVLSSASGPTRPSIGRSALTSSFNRDDVVVEVDRKRIDRRSASGALAAGGEKASAWIRIFSDGQVDHRERVVVAVTGNRVHLDDRFPSVNTALSVNVWDVAGSFDAGQPVGDERVAGPPTPSRSKACLTAWVTIVAPSSTYVRSPARMVEVSVRVDQVAGSACRGSGSFTFAITASDRSSCCGPSTTTMWSAWLMATLWCDPPAT